MLLLSSCNFDINPIARFTPTPGAPLVTSDQNLPHALVTFEAVVPGDGLEGFVILEVLDEVTGLALNPQRYPMVEKTPGTYSVEIPIPVGSTVKYRYLRQEQTIAVEYTASGSQVRYRLAIIDGPMVIQDVVAGWTDYPYNGPVGRIEGQVVAAGSNTPVPSALVICGGNRTVTASDGSFLLESVNPGTHNLVVYSMDGSFLPFQQGALVAENASTPAFITLTPAGKVRVTFVVQIPETNIEGLPVRMVGNISPLGNTFADLEGGLSVVASRAPLLTQVSKGIYSITQELPVGLDLRYKYTLGDGFWNAEHTGDGRFRLRQLIVPSTDVTQTDVVETWKDGDAAPIIFSVKAPDNTPKEDQISIQFNPFIWTTPLPMWPLGDNRWIYVLYSPLDLVKNAGYRYCRNDQCGVADDLATIGPTAPGRPFTAGNQEQTIQDEIQQWAWWSTAQEPTTIIAPEIEPRSGFIAGIEFSHHYSPAWQPYHHLGMENARLSGAGWLLLSPTWHFTRLSPPVIEPLPGSDPPWQDSVQAIQTAQRGGLQVGLFPRLLELHTDAAWQLPINDPGWWQSWFERYRVFILNYADMAEQTGSQLLILGGPDVLPALPGGLAQNGEPSGVPSGSVEVWINLLEEVRGRYHGKIAWALPYPQGLDTLPEFLDQVDLIYVLFSARLSDSADADEGTLQLAFGGLLDRDLFPIYEETNVPVVIGLDYPSVDGAATGCIQSNGYCLDFDRFSQPQPDIPEIKVDLVEQARIYGAAFNAVYSREWVSGIVSRGFYPVTALQDKSSSVHGKPAADILWYWFPKLVGQ
jgi:hypothetical protein